VPDHEAEQVRANARTLAQQLVWDAPPDLDERVDRIALQLVGAYWAGYRAGAAHVEPLEWHPAADGPRPADAGHLWRPGEAQQ
jgi:hypothetical protein